jgi:hypothetical protein
MNEGTSGPGAIPPHSPIEHAAKGRGWPGPPSVAVRPAVAAWLALPLIAVIGLSAAAAPAVPGMSLAEFLASKQIDAASRRLLAEGGAWSDDKERVVVRVLSRLSAPASLEAAWRKDAVEGAAGGQSAPGDRLVRVRGRATFVAPRELSREIAELAGWPGYDIVRIVSPDAGAVDVVVRRAPRSWPRGRPIDEPAEVVGLPLAAAGGPVPKSEAGQAWPAAPAGLLLAATHVAWQPATLLGALGFDYALFDTVVDNRRLQPGDSDAFWALLAAVGRAASPDVEKAAGGRTEVLPLIDPARKWFASHRGEPVVIEGIARKATRIAIDSPEDRERVGGDHYWELDVFSDTPTIQVNDRIQDRYPIVCCVRTLPAGMPTGDVIDERVRVPAFAFKRYAYSIREPVDEPAPGEPTTREERMATPLVVGREAIWLKTPSTTGVSNTLFWLFAGITGLVGLVLGYNAWSWSREIKRRERQRREEMSDRIDLPGQRE